MTFVEAALDLQTHLRSLSPEQRLERRRHQRRRADARYRLTEKARARAARYEATPKARARKEFYERTIRAAMRTPAGLVAGVRRDGRQKYWPFGGYAVTYARPADYGITAPSPELVRFEQRMRSDEFAARAEYALLQRRERAAGITGPLTLGALAAAAVGGA